MLSSGSPNAVTRYSGKVVPANVDIIYDPISGQRYLTNNAGFYYNLSGIVYIYIDEIATSFSGDFYAGVENDMTTMELEVYGRGPDGLYYEFDIYGAGKLTAAYGGKASLSQPKTSTVKMNHVSAKMVPGYAENSEQ